MGVDKQKLIECANKIKAEAERYRTGEAKLIRNLAFEQWVKPFRLLLNSREIASIDNKNVKELVYQSRNLVNCFTPGYSGSKAWAGLVIRSSNDILNILESDLTSAGLDLPSLTAKVVSEVCEELKITGYSAYIKPIPISANTLWLYDADLNNNPFHGGLESTLLDSLLKQLGKYGKVTLQRQKRGNDYCFEFIVDPKKALQGD